MFGILATSFFADERGVRPASQYLSTTHDWGIKLPLVVTLLLIWFIVTATSNGANLTDGADGLLAGTSALVFGAYTIVNIWQNNQLCGSSRPTTVASQCYQVRDPLDLAVFAAAITAACVGFLWWNAKPARIIMGDVGSLALGGALAGLAIMSRTELLMAVIAGLFVLETVSVLLQTSYFKLTRRITGTGRRIFRIAPVHHHFEHLGWDEVTVVIRFWIIAGICVADRPRDLLRLVAGLIGWWGHTPYAPPVTTGDDTTTQAKRKHLSWWQESLLLLVIAVVVAVVREDLLRAGLLHPLAVDGPRAGQERPDPGGEAVVLVRRTPQRGDVVVFEDPGGWLPPEDSEPPNRAADRAVQDRPLPRRRPPGEAGHRRAPATSSCAATTRAGSRVNGQPLDEDDYVNHPDEVDLSWPDGSGRLRLDGRSDPGRRPLRHGRQPRELRRLQRPHVPRRARRSCDPGRRVRRRGPGRRPGLRRHLAARPHHRLHRPDTFSDVPDAASD